VPDSHRRRWWWVLVATGLGSWLVTASLSTVNVAFTELQRHFEGRSLTAIGWIVTAYSIAFGALLVPAGRIADRFGRRRVFDLGLALFAVGALSCIVAPGLGGLIVGRVLQGIGGAVIVPASLGLLLEVSAEGERLRAVSFWAASNTIGGASGPTLGALVVAVGGWRAVFVFSALAAALTWAIGSVHLPASGPSDTASTIDGPGVVLTALVMASATLVISEGNAWGWSSPGLLGLAVLCVVAAVVLVVRSRAQPYPVLPVDLFRHRRFSVGTAALLVFGVAGGGLQLLNVLFMRNVWGYSALEAGIGVTPAPLFATLMAPFTSRLGQRFGERAVAVPGAVVVAAGVAGYLLLDETPRYWSHYFPASALSGIGVSMLFAMLSSAAVRDADAARLSLASGAARTANQLGTAAGLALLFVILGEGVGSLERYRQGWFLILAMTGVTLVLASALAPWRRAGLDAARPRPAVSG
jgi:EmrB/QacA subfamily drug resistance transporter